MRRLSVLFALFALFLLVTSRPAFALPHVVRGVAENRAFLAELAEFVVSSEYGNHRLYDVRRIGVKRVGLVLLCPLGFEIRMVWDGEDEIYRDMFVPEKSKREAMARASIRLADAVRLARAAVAYERRGVSD